jgi:predicted lipid-binding transport protein (Tim44 family)
MYEVILYAAIATVVCVMFYSVLGKSVGKGPEDAIDPDNYMKVGSKDASSVVTPISPEMESKGLGAIAKKDSNFSPAFFVDGAKQAYSMILEAYAAGDRAMLSNLLEAQTLKAYEDAISAREAAGHKQVTDLGRLRKTSIKSAKINGSVAHIAVLYEADLTSALMDEDGTVVQGDPDVLSSISEVWTYERDLKSSDPTWRLSDVEPSGGDNLEADPSPDTKPSV